ncbi:extracellular solute-binding protein [Yinghuangia seranimata]|uniref:extracellular solute-binding protein n=1 Tax=Yinghuangia seranimata TaxID=408067 RepID=UPI00248B4810|nr:extracellular solute-binding protein [Yinghuangia seranimata]MDI2131658.1 extracellular solute-binding protein [Yinghuangia seranimata]
MRRSLSAAVAAAALALTLTACGDDGGDTTSTTPQGAAAQDPAAVSGTVTWWDTSDSTSEAPAYKELIAKFEAQYPKIKVKYENIPFDDARDKFKTAAQGNSGAPDVLRADVGWTPSFAELGYLQPLDGTPALNAKEDFLPGGYASTQYKGKTYGAPMVTDALALLYNKDLLAKAGVAKPPTTWAEVKAAALAVKEKTGASGVFMKAQGYYALPLIYGEGGDLVDMNAKKVTVNDDKAVAGVSIGKDLLDSGAAVTDVTKDAYTNMQNLFKDGKVAMLINGPWSVADDLKGSAFSTPGNLGIAPVPAGSSGKNGSPTGGHNLVVYAGSKHLDASYLFVQFLTNAESQGYAAQKNHVLPTRASVYSQPAIAGDTQITQFRTVLDASRPRIALPQASDLFDPLDDSMEKIYSGQASVKSGLDDTAKAAKKILPGFN